MTTKFIISFLLITLTSYFTCGRVPVEEKRVNLSDKYLCEEFKINSEQYGPNVTYDFRVKVMIMGSDSLQIDKLSNNLYQFGNQAKFTFKIVSIENRDICTDGRISYLEMLENNYSPGFITIIIVCDDMKFDEEGKNGSRIDGATLGIPTLEDPTLGRPVLFVRNSSAYGKILHHELGHIWNLSHSFKDYDMVEKGLTCNAYIGDGQPDTVTPLRLGSVGERSCEYYAPEGALKDYTSEEILNLVKNPMSYSPEKCMDKFTESQIQKMRKAVEVNSRLQDCII